MQLHWHTEPFLLIALLGMSWCYTLCSGPLRQRWDPYFHTRPFPRWKSFSFHSAVVIAYLAVGSPLDQLGEDYLFVLHMVQHMLLVYLIPLFMYLGLPSDLVDHVLEHRMIRAVWKVLAHPVVAGLSFSLVFTLWHVPMLYELALHNKPVHILEHVTMFGTAMMMWWPILSPSSRFIPKSSYGVQILYAFLLMVAQLPVFAFLSFANVAIYETYVWAPRIIPGLDPLNDQVLGGITMKVFNMGASLTIISTCFYRWAMKDEAQTASEML